jgi:hypothetical protein
LATYTDQTGEVQEYPEEVNGWDWSRNGLNRLLEEAIIIIVATRSVPVLIVVFPSSVHVYKRKNISFVRTIFVHL